MRTPSRALRPAIECDLFSSNICQTHRPAVERAPVRSANSVSTLLIGALGLAWHGNLFYVIRTLLANDLLAAAVLIGHVTYFSSFRYLSIVFAWEREDEGRQPDDSDIDGDDAVPESGGAGSSAAVAPAETVALPRLTRQGTVARSLRTVKRPVGSAKGLYKTYKELFGMRGKYLALRLAFQESMMEVSPT